MMIRLMVLLFCLILQAYADADEESRRPYACKNVGYRFFMNTLELQPRSEGDKESLYFFYNQSDEPLLLYHLLGQKAYTQTFLNQQLAPKQWAALILGEKKVRFLCAQGDDRHIVSCPSNLTVCEFAKTRFGINNRGHFWLVIAASKEQAIRQVEHYGIVPE